MDGPRGACSRGRGALTGPRVALFGSGSPTSMVVLSALLEQTPPVAVVLPGARPGLGVRSLHRRFRRRRVTAALREAAQRCRVPCLSYRPGRPDRLAAQLRALGVDLVCVATFPYLLSAEVLRAVPEGAIGIHPSVLPRHRGPDPLFWTYHCDDAETGVSVIRLDAGADTGGLLRQERLPLVRGRLGSDLYFDLGHRGAGLLAGTVAAWDAWRSSAQPQDEGRASHEPAPRAGRGRIDFETWSAERVWHFLRGVGERSGILRGADGRALSHGVALSFTLGVQRSSPGTIDAHAAGLTVHCRDGAVEVGLAPAPAAR